jgi:RHS repeat-associated protein
MLPAAEERTPALTSGEEIFSLAAGVDLATLETHQGPHAAQGKKPHQGIFSRNRTTTVGAARAKWSATHQDRKCSWSKTVSGSALDANGNTLSDASGRSFTWDFENRMVSAVVPGTGTVSFKYDPFGRRIYKQSPSFTSAFLYDGADLLETVNGSGSEVASYTQGLGVDELLAMQRSGTADYFEADGLGSITSLSGSAGALANTYTYDSFGNTTTSTGTVRNYFQYTAREFDPETTLYYYRSRYFDQTLGRFISEDQSDEGSLYDALNLYMYVQNNPVNNTDPFGKYTLKPGVPPPSAAVAALLDCIEALSGVPLVVTSTSDSHSATDPHTRGLAADIRYPSDPAAVLNAASCCGAQYAQDEKKHPSANATAPHIHVQLVPGKRGGHGDLPANAKCKDCSKD